MVKVSIIVPVYNVEKYLRECIESIINQTLREIEIICVNDGSTDSSLDILREYRKSDDRVIIIDKANAGYGHTMNRGIEKASGKYIGIVESDDYVVPHMYERLYEIAEQYNVDIIKADFNRFIYENGEMKCTYNKLTNIWDGYYNKVIDPAKNKVIFRFIMNTWSGIYNTNFIRTNNINHNETPGASYQDNGFFFKTFCNAKRIYFLDEPLYMNRRDNMDSSVLCKGKVYCSSEEYAYIWDYLNENPDLKKQYSGMFFVKKLHNYLFTFNRIGDESKNEFLEHFSKEFRESLENCEIDSKSFRKGEWNTMLRIIYERNSYYASRMGEEKSNLTGKNLLYKLANIIIFWADNGFTKACKHVCKKIIRKFKR